MRLGARDAGLTGVWLDPARRRMPGTRGRPPRSSGSGELPALASAVLIAGYQTPIVLRRSAARGKGAGTGGR